MNIFEGSRRIAYLIGGVVVVVVLAVTATYDPYISINYSISHPDATPQRMEESCPEKAGRAFISSKSQSGIPVSVNLCLLTMEFGDDKQKLVPYKIDEKGMIWGAVSYSDEVNRYMDTVESNFSIPNGDNKWIEDEKSRQYWGRWKDNILGLAVGLSIFAIFVWAVGWVVRGFVGIPRGLDKKPENPQKGPK